MGMDRARVRGGRDAGAAPAARPKGWDLQAEIRSGATAYPRQQKRLATFLLDNWNEIPLLSIERISSKSGVSMASITRFTRRLGCRGFYDFKNKVKGELMRMIANPVERFFSVPAQIQGKRSLIKAAHQDVKNINALLAGISEDAFRRLVGLIEKSRRVCTFGVGISSILADLFAYTLNQIQKDASRLDEGSIPVEERIFCMRKDELLVFSSFFPYSRCTVEFARLAHERGLPIVLLTDNEYSPIARYAALLLKFPRENILFTTSISALSVLFNAVATEIALKKKDELSLSLKEMDRTLRGFYA
jgi:DNA-binding MurR/RpiR family transcriptional regulator